jgi:hypothetical protein
MYWIVTRKVCNVLYNIQYRHFYFLFVVLTLFFFFFCSFKNFPLWSETLLHQLFVLICHFTVYSLSLKFVFIFLHWKVSLSSLSPHHPFSSQRQSVCDFLAHPSRCTLCIKQIYIYIKPPTNTFVYLVLFYTSSFFSYVWIPLNRYGIIYVMRHFHWF